MQFEKWCSDRGGYLNDEDDGARAARLMAVNAWDAAVAAERERWSRASELAALCAEWHMGDGDECGVIARELLTLLTPND